MNQMSLIAPKPPPAGLNDAIKRPAPPTPTKPARPIPRDPDHLVMARFHNFSTPAGEQAWVDDPNTPQRFVIRRTNSAFQAYQKLEGEFFSMGYIENRKDVNAFLTGNGCPLVDTADADTTTHRAFYSALPLREYK